MSVPAFSITVSMSSNNAKTEVSLTQSYDIDKSTDLRVRTGLGEGTIMQTQWASGQGNNKISQSLSNGDQSAYQRNLFRKLLRPELQHFGHRNDVGLEYKLRGIWRNQKSAFRIDRIFLCHPGGLDIRRQPDLKSSPNCTM